MSRSHRIITVNPSIRSQNHLHVMQGIVKTLKSSEHVKVTSITASTDMDMFMVHFKYKDENRSLFMCKCMDNYETVDGGKIYSGGLYTNLNVFGKSREIMNLVKRGILDHTPVDVDVYESLDDSIDHCFVRVNRDLRR